MFGFKKAKNMNLREQLEKFISLFGYKRCFMWDDMITYKIVHSLSKEVIRQAEEIIQDYNLYLLEVQVLEGSSVFSEMLIIRQKISY
jgi:hypothetical protein